MLIGFFHFHIGVKSLAAYFRFTQNYSKSNSTEPILNLIRNFNPMIVLIIIFKLFDVVDFQTSLFLKSKHFLILFLAVYSVTTLFIVPAVNQMGLIGMPYQIYKTHQMSLFSMKQIHLFQNH